MPAILTGSPARCNARSKIACNAYSPLTEMFIGIGWRNHLHPSRDCRPREETGATACGAARIGRPIAFLARRELERKARLEFDAPVVGDAAAAPAPAESAAAEPGVHAGGLAELWRIQVAHVAARIEVVQHVGEVHAQGQVVAMLRGV